MNISAPHWARLIIKANDGTATADHVAAALDEVAALKSRVKEIESDVETAAAAFVTANGPVRMGNIEWRMSQVKSIKCNDIKNAVGALLDATGGDLDKLTECISSNGIKHGAARTVLGEAVFASHFTTTIKQDLEGKPLKELTRIDTTFTKGRK